MAGEQVSGYEDYTTASKDYDKSRVIIGFEVILGSLSVSSGRPLRDLHVLDAGCGTGNYTYALSKHVGRVTGLELNEGMLSQARRKTAAMANVELHGGSVLKMPFSDGEFDGVVCNLVIHHLDVADTTGFKNVAQFVAEAYRVLKPGGALIINTILPEQIESGVMWFDTLIPEAQKKLQRRFIPLSEIHRMMTTSGFTLGPVYNLTGETLCPKEIWCDRNGPFSQEWRNGNSVWSLATPEELQSALDFWRKLLDEGKADEYIAKYESKRKELGIATTLIGTK